MKQQKGIALITILMLVALATIIAATIAQRQTNTNENTAYLIRQNQSLSYAKSAEAFVSELLVQDAESNSKSDHLQETWAQPLPAFPIEGGYIAGQIVDETGKFNLNSLLADDGTPNLQTQALFIELLKRVGLPVDLYQAVIDWQDQDDLTIGAMGAESNYYSTLTKPYLPSNAPFHSVEELKKVRGFEAGNFQLIEAYVTAIPLNKTKINVNTAPAMILASLDEGIDLKSLENEIKQKQNNLEFFENIDQLWELPSLSKVSAEKKKIAQDNFDVKSMFYRVNIEVMLSERQRYFSSYLMRNGNSVYVYSRSLAPFISNVSKTSK